MSYLLIFRCALVISLIIFKSNKEIVVTPSCVYRDIGIYLFATIYILIITILGKITVAISVSLLLIYFALVLIVFIQDYLASKETLIKKQSFIDKKAKDSSEKPLLYKETKENDREKQKNSLRHKFNLKNLAKKIKYHLTVMTIATKIVLLAKFKYRQEQHQKLFKDKNFLGKISFILDFPFDLLRKLTIPPCEPKNFNKTWLFLWPIPGLFLITWTIFGTITILSIRIIIPLAISLKILIYFTCPHDKLPKYLIFIEILGLFMSIIWTYLISTILIDLLQMWTIFTGISATYMGLTVIAVGSALPDAITTLALSGKGYGDMAITGNYSSQCFGLLVGFGLAMLRKTVSKGTQYFDLWSFKRIDEFILPSTAFAV